MSDTPLSSYQIAQYLTRKSHHPSNGVVLPSPLVTLDHLDINHMALLSNEIKIENRDGCVEHVL